jgi:hypothetical protein
MCLRPKLSEILNHANYDFLFKSNGDLVLAEIEMPSLFSLGLICEQCPLWSQCSANSVSATARNVNKLNPPPPRNKPLSKKDINTTRPTWEMVLGVNMITLHLGLSNIGQIMFLCVKVTHVKTSHSLSHHF